MSKSTRILLLEKSLQFKNCLKILLNDMTTLNVVGDARVFKQGIALAADLKPDLILLDTKIPGSTLAEACISLRSAHRKVRIIVMTESETEDEVFAALASGADGYCLKELDSTKFAVGIQIVADGDFWLDPGVARHVVKSVDLRMKRFIAASAKPAKKKKEDDELSARELEVLQLVALGCSNLQIARKLDISAETVKTHIRHIMKKLVVRDRTQAAVKGLKQGLI